MPTVLAFGFAKRRSEECEDPLLLTADIAERDDQVTFAAVSEAVLGGVIVHGI
jgi:hypothetical protein